LLVYVGLGMQPGWWGNWLWKAAGQISLETSYHWEGGMDDIKVDLRKMGLVEDRWMDVAEDRVQW
jgi:hypothetical protein